MSQVSDKQAGRPEWNNEQKTTKTPKTEKEQNNNLNYKIDYRVSKIDFS